MTNRRLRFHLYLTWAVFAAIIFFGAMTALGNELSAHPWFDPETAWQFSPAR